MKNVGILGITVYAYFEYEMLVSGCTYSVAGLTV